MSQHVTYKDLLDWAHAHVQALSHSGAAPWHVLRAEMLRDGLAQREPDAINGWPVQRLYDMVRYCRHFLHDERLLTNEEYGRLVATGASSARRLESYDALQRKVDRMGAALSSIGCLGSDARSDPHGVLRAAIEVALNALSADPAAEADSWPQWLVRWMAVPGEPIGSSVTPLGGAAYGYGKVAGHGWQVPVPPEFVDALRRHAQAHVEREGLVPRDPAGDADARRT